MRRCDWAQGELLVAYHDIEWGMPVHGEQALFERLSLEAFQAGLSWATILAKRPAFRQAFHGFDPEAIASYGERDLERLLADERIVRNRRKIKAVIANAAAVLELRGDGGLDRLIWSHKPARTLAPRSHAEIPTRTPGSAALAAELRARGFRFVGPTGCFALMEAIGLVDTHVLGCHRRGASGVHPPNTLSETGQRPG
ncbi:DNA-3-methyladenine glycosylase I [Nonomuraea jabiensis]|uniref:DNA-3-methyladenine glycosylase I n=1 Tax=Nonomuraea jabiensis TaxID=882448 RepID=UPI003D72C0B7